MLRIIQQRIMPTVRCQSSRLLSSTSACLSSADGKGDNSSDSMPKERGVNKVQLLGRVGRTPELRGSDEYPCYVFPLATNFNYRKANGDRLTRTDWHRITVFKPALREYVVPRIEKGDRLYAEGPINYSRYTDKSGQTFTITSINADELIIIGHSRRGADDVETAEDVDNL